MEKSIKLTLGILGCLSLFCLNSSMLGPLNGFVTNYIFIFTSILATFFIIYFSIVLIIDTLKYIHRK